MELEDVHCLSKGIGRLLTSGKSCSTRGLRLPSGLEKRGGVAAADYLHSSGGCQPSLLSQKVQYTYLLICILASCCTCYKQYIVIRPSKQMNEASKCK
jgi:hypothetical protein